MSFLILLVTAALVLAFVLSVRRDPRWTGNAFLLTIAATSVLFTLAAWGEGGLGTLVGAAMALLVVLSPLLLLVLVVFLIANGMTMMRKEGRSLGNLLSLLAGLGIIATGIFGIVGLVTLRWQSWVLPVLILVFLLCCWAAFLLVSYLVYTLAYPLITRGVGADYVMVHGSGLIRGKAPALLRSRIDAGIARWQGIRAEHPSAPIILSGGQGPDEPRSEASAMAEYAIGVGVPAEAIWLEDASATTGENLRNTKRMVAERLPAGTRGITVTSSYHVVRTAALARQVGLDAQVAPARTAGYFFPSAFLREAVALVAEHKIAHALAAAIVCLPLPTLLALVVLG